MDRLKATNPFALEAEGLCRGGSLGLYMVRIDLTISITRYMSKILEEHNYDLMITKTLNSHHFY